MNKNVWVVNYQTYCGQNHTKHNKRIKRQIFVRRHVDFYKKVTISGATIELFFEYENIQGLLLCSLFSTVLASDHASCRKSSCGTNFMTRLLMT